MFWQSSKRHIADESPELCAVQCELEFPEQFYAATIFAKDPPKGAERVGDDTKLLLYALYQQATQGENKTPKPWGWKQMEALKWNAWTELSEMPPSDAMVLYVSTLEEDNPDWWNLLSEGGDAEKVKSICLEATFAALENLGGQEDIQSAMELAEELSKAGANESTTQEAQPAAQGAQFNSVTTDETISDTALCIQAKAHAVLHDILRASNVDDSCVSEESIDPTQPMQADNAMTKLHQLSEQISIQKKKFEHLKLKMKHQLHTDLEPQRKVLKKEMEEMEVKLKEQEARERKRSPGLRQRKPEATALMEKRKQVAKQKEALEESLAEMEQASAVAVVELERVALEEIANLQAAMQRHRVDSSAGGLLSNTRARGMLAKRQKAVEATMQVRVKSKQNSLQLQRKQLLVRIEAMQQELIQLDADCSSIAPEDLVQDTVHMTKEMVLTELSMLERQAELEQLDVKLHSAEAHIDQQFDESLSHLNAFVEDIRLASKEISKSLAKHETVLDLPTTQRVASVVAAFGASAEDRVDCLRQLEVEVEAARSELLETVAAQAAELAQRMALKEQEMNTWVAAVPEEPRTEDDVSQVKAEQGGPPSEDVLETERKASDEDIAVSEKELQAMIEQVQEEVDAEVKAEQGGSPSEDVLETERKASDEDIVVSEKELQAMIEQVQEEVDAEGLEKSNAEDAAQCCKRMDALADEIRKEMKTTDSEKKQMQFHSMIQHLDQLRDGMHASLLGEVQDILNQIETRFERAVKSPEDVKEETKEDSAIANAKIEMEELAQRVARALEQPSSGKKQEQLRSIAKCLDQLRDKMHAAPLTEVHDDLEQLEFRLEVLLKGSEVMFEGLDLKEDEWTEIHSADLNTVPLPRHHHGCAVLGTKMCVVGGSYGSRALNDIQVFDMCTLTWSKITASSGTLPAISGAVCLTYKGKIYVVGGEARHDATSAMTIMELEMKGGSTTVHTVVVREGEPPCVRSGHTATLVGSEVYIFGGEDPKTNQPLADMHVFNLNTQAWSEPVMRGATPSARSGHSVWGINSTLFLFGGQPTTGYTNEIFTYNCATATWAKKVCQGIAPIQRQFAASAVVALRDSTMVLAGGSHDTRALADVHALALSAGYSLRWAPVSAELRHGGKGSSLCLVEDAVKDTSYLVLYGGYTGKFNKNVYVLKVGDALTSAWGPVAMRGKELLSEQSSVIADEISEGMEKRMISEKSPKTSAVPAELLNDLRVASEKGPSAVEQHSDKPISASFGSEACAEEVRSAAVLAARTAARKGASQAKGPGQAAALSVSAAVEAAAEKAASYTLAMLQWNEARFENLLQKHQQELLEEKGSKVETLTQEISQLEALHEANVESMIAKHAAELQDLKNQLDAERASLKAEMEERARQTVEVVEENARKKIETLEAENKRLKKTSVSKDNLQVSEIAVLKLENQKLQKALKTMDALENQVHDLMGADGQAGSNGKASKDWLGGAMESVLSSKGVQDSKGESTASPKSPSRRFHFDEDSDVGANEKPMLSKIEKPMLSKMEKPNSSRASRFNFDDDE